MGSVSTLRRASRLKDKLERYMEVVAEKSRLEADPELSLALFGRLPRAGSGLQGKSHGFNGHLLEAVRSMSGDFDARDLLPHVQEQGVSVKRLNDRLRRLEAVGELELVSEGRRGRGGSLPRYRIKGLEVPESPGS
jgi:hypothetical protein